MGYFYAIPAVFIFLCCLKFFHKNDFAQTFNESPFITKPGCLIFCCTGLNRGGDKWRERVPCWVFVTKAVQNKQITVKMAF